MNEFNEVILLSFQVLNENLKELTDKFEEATAAKVKCQQEADATQLTISLANRLVGGLASENVRWAEAVEKFKKEETMLVGNVLMITGMKNKMKEFISFRLFYFF